MDDRKMDHVITKIGDPVFVGTAGPDDQCFDHIEVRVELNKELSEEDFRSAYREALLSSYRKVPEMVSRNKDFIPADARKRSRDPDRLRPSSRPDRPRPVRRRSVTGDL